MFYVTVFERKALHFIDIKQNFVDHLFTRNNRPKINVASAVVKQLNSKIGLIYHYI